MIGVWNLVGVGAEGVVMAKDVLLNGFAHESTDGQQMLGAIFVPHHLLYPRSIPQQSLFVALIALDNFLLLVLLLGDSLVDHVHTLNVASITSCILRISSKSMTRST